MRHKRHCRYQVATYNLLMQGGLVTTFGNNGLPVIQSRRGREARQRVLFAHANGDFLRHVGRRQGKGSHCVYVTDLCGNTVAIPTTTGERMEGRKSKISFGEDLLDSDSSSFCPWFGPCRRRHRDKIFALPGPFAVCRGTAGSANSHTHTHTK